MSFIIKNNGIVGCPNCYQLLQLTDIQTKQVDKILNEGKSCTEICPKCNHNFLITPEGTEQIPEEKEKHQVTRSCCHKEVSY